MPKATWRGVVLAEADDGEVELVEGNVYFPPHAINQEYFQESETHTYCLWKGTASYYDVVVNGDVNETSTNILPLSI